MSTNKAGGTLLITGGCGYLGSRLLIDVATFGAGFRRIRILDNFHRGRYDALLDLPEGPKYELVEGDILDASAVRQALAGVDAVIHLAALVATPFSFDNPSWLEQVNHWGSASLVERCLEQEVTRFIYASSASVYGPGHDYSEDATCTPLGPYSSSKFKGELAVRKAGNRGLEWTILRLGTLWGLAPAMRFNAVVNRLAMLAGTGRSIPVFGSGQQRRPFIEVRDAVRSLLYVLGDPQAIGQVFNASTENRSVEELAGIAERVSPSIHARRVEQDLRTELSLSVDSTKLRAAGWVPEVTLEEGLPEVLAHFRGFASSDYREVTDLLEE